MKNKCPQNNAQKTKDRTTRTSRKSHSELMYSKYYCNDRSGCNTLLVYCKTILNAVLSLMEREYVLLYSNNQ